eukprot:3101-Heterococcus_DN1.PRE.2
MESRSSTINPASEPGCVHCAEATAVSWAAARNQQLTAYKVSLYVPGRSALATSGSTGPHSSLSCSTVSVPPITASASSGPDTSVVIISCSDSTHGASMQQQCETRVVHETA